MPEQQPDALPREVQEQLQKMASELRTTLLRDQEAVKRG
jgi:cation transport regulator ChaB